MMPNQQSPLMILTKIIVTYIGIFGNFLFLDLFVKLSTTFIHVYVFCSLIITALILKYVGTRKTDK